MRNNAGQTHIFRKHLNRQIHHQTAKDVQKHFVVHDPCPKFRIQQKILHHMSSHHAAAAKHENAKRQS